MLYSSFWMSAADLIVHILLLVFRQDVTVCCPRIGHLFCFLQHACVTCKFGADRGEVFIQEDYFVWLLFIMAFQLEARSQYLVSSCFDSKSDNEWASATCALFVSLRPKAMAALNLVSLNGWFERHFVAYY